MNARITNCIRIELTGNIAPKFAEFCIYENRLALKKSCFMGPNFYSAIHRMEDRDAIRAFLINEDITLEEIDT